MSGTKQDNTRAEEFKRATAGVLRAIAEQPDVQVAFQPWVTRCVPGNVNVSDHPATGSPRLVIFTAPPNPPPPPQLFAV